MDRQKAITLAHPNCVSVFGENDAYDKNKNKIVLDEDKIKIEFDKLTAEFQATQYQRDRAVAYPPLAEQMDILYHGGIDALKVELKKTKDKYPKP